MSNQIKAESLLISVAFDSENKVSLMVVGKKRKNETVDIVNAFQRDDAARLYHELITKRG